MSNDYRRQNPNHPGVEPSEFIRIDHNSIPPDMELTFPGGKLHGVTITEAQLHYHGSVTIDAELLEEAGLLPMEFVNIWSKSSMARISTYIVPGTRGSGIICLNGGAARFFQVGDEAVITSERRIRMKDLSAYKTKIVTFHPRHEANTDCCVYNRIWEVMSYELVKAHEGWRFELMSLEKRPLLK